MGCRSEVGLSIIKAVVVYVVDEQVRGQLQDAAMHGYCFAGCGRESVFSDSVEAISLPDGVPLVLCQAGVILGVDDG